MPSIETTELFITYNYILQLVIHWKQCRMTDRKENSDGQNVCNNAQKLLGIILNVLELTVDDKMTCTSAILSKRYFSKQSCSMFFHFLWIWRFFCSIVTGEFYDEMIGLTQWAVRWNIFRIELNNKYSQMFWFNEASTF